MFESDKTNQMFYDFTLVYIRNELTPSFLSQTFTRRTNHKDDIPAATFPISTHCSNWIPLTRSTDETGLSSPKPPCWFRLKQSLDQYLSKIGSQHLEPRSLRKTNGKVEKEDRNTCPAGWKNETQNGNRDQNDLKIKREQNVLGRQKGILQSNLTTFFRRFGY